MSQQERSPDRAQALPRVPGPRTRLYVPFLLLATLVAFTDLGGRSVHDMDVPRGAALAREMIQSGHWLVPRLAGEIYVNKPPLYIWLVALPSVLAGDVTPFLARLPAALALVALVLVAMGWARGRTGSDTVARITGLLLLSTLVLVWLGREAKLDMLAATLGFSGAALLDAAAHGRAPPRHHLWAGLLLGLALLTKGPLVLLVPVVVLLVGGEPGSDPWTRLKRARIGRTLGLAVLVGLAWFVPALVQGGSAYGEALLLDQAATRLAGAGNHLEPPWYYAAAIPIWALPWGPLFMGLLAMACVPRWSVKLGPTAGLARAAAVLVLLYSLVPTKHIRYLAPVLPLLVIALAYAIRVHVLPRLPRHLRPGLVFTALNLLVAVGIVVACRRSIVGGWAALVPATGIAAVGVWGYRQRRERLALPWAVLLSAVFAILALAVLRYRFRVPRNVTFNEQLARTLEAPASGVWTVSPWRPEDVFLGAPHARHLGRAAEANMASLPPGAIIVCRAVDRAKLEHARGEPAQVLFIEPRAGDRARQILRFGLPVPGD